MNRDRLLRDVVGELQVVMKADASSDIEPAHIPLLRIAADHLDSSATLVSDALQMLLTTAINRLDSPTRDALSRLFLGDQRSQSLAHRGAAAASTLGITYDALRRRGKSGHRRLDSLLTELGESIYEVVPLEQLVLGSQQSVRVADPGQNAYERASIFLSYSQADDQHEGGFITSLRESLISEFRFQTGQDLVVFQDRTNIGLGENWRRKIETLIDTTSFLLVVLTPSYLRSETCRAELERFLARERELGRDDLVLPVYYATVPEGARDGLAHTLLARQYVDWRAMRFQAFSDVPVRMAVADLATSIASALGRTAQPSRRPIEDTLTQELGLAERLAEMELALPRFVRSMLTLAEEQDGVTEEVREATEEIERMNRSGRGSAARLIVARRLSSRLEPYAERMEEAANSIRSDLSTIESGVHSLAQEVPSSDEEGVEDATRQMIEATRTTYEAAVQASESIDAMGASYEGVARTVSTMRPILNRLLGSSRVVNECPPRFAGWIAELEDALRTRVEQEA